MNPINELEQLVGMFPEPAGEPLYLKAEHVAKEATPEPYRQMLVHEHHMTITMEAFHKCAVEVIVIDSRFENELYLRRSLLRKQNAPNKMVQLGYVRFNFEYVTECVKREILEGKTPLGRVLIQHNVLRHVDLGAIIRFTAGPGLVKTLQMAEGQVTYGRMATIFCNGSPAIDLLEISGPLD